MQQTCSATNAFVKIAMQTECNANNKCNATKTMQWKKQCNNKRNAG